MYILLKYLFFNYENLWEIVYLRRSNVTSIDSVGFATCRINNRVTSARSIRYDILFPPIKYFSRRSFYRRRIFLARHNSSINRVAGRRELFYRLPSFHLSHPKNLHSSRGNGDAFCRNEIKDKERGVRKKEREKKKRKSFLILCGERPRWISPSLSKWEPESGRRRSRELRGREESRRERVTRDQHPAQLYDTYRSNPLTCIQESSLAVTLDIDGCP